ncbi:hypothetical protein CJ030_MR5G023970 [Morella rubra]|uniref:Uncharacterized protein n=1 Tax=Morella rubra TaxID=262757 RepID=A0A6A1VKS6_9ROSI|nr:hypothetical protein CJ030_MR5G023970 [Morella rubra]
MQTAKVKEIVELKARQAEIENILGEQWKRHEMQEMQLLECEEMPIRERREEQKRIGDSLRFEMEMQSKQKIDKFMKQMPARHS